MIGIIGGSGFYELFKKKPEEKIIKTPYGEPSEPIMIGKISGKEVVFLPRHGKDHRFPPHNVPYRANIYALHELGVDKLISFSSCGALQKELNPGDFVIVDQFIDKTKRRMDSFVEGPDVDHLSAAEVYDKDLRSAIIASCAKIKIPHKKGGTVVVIEGPRFSSKAESAYYSKMGWDVINMTQYPENVLSAEKGIKFAGVLLVTDHDAGVHRDEDVAAVTWDEIKRVMENNIHHAKALIEEVVKQI